MSAPRLLDWAGAAGRSGSVNYDPVGSSWVRTRNDHEHQRGPARHQDSRNPLNTNISQHGSKLGGSPGNSGESTLNPESPKVPGRFSAQLPRRALGVDAHTREVSCLGPRDWTRADPTDDRVLRRTPARWRRQPTPLSSRGCKSHTSPYGTKTLRRYPHPDVEPRTSRTSLGNLTLVGAGAGSSRSGSSLAAGEGPHPIPTRARQRTHRVVHDGGERVDAERQGGRAARPQFPGLPWCDSPIPAGSRRPCGGRQVAALRSCRWRQAAHRAARS